MRIVYLKSSQTLSLYLHETFLNLFLISDNCDYVENILFKLVRNLAGLLEFGPQSIKLYLAGLTIFLLYSPEASRAPLLFSSAFLLNLSITSRTTSSGNKERISNTYL